MADPVPRPITPSPSPAELAYQMALAKMLREMASGGKPTPMK